MNQILTIGYEGLSQQQFLARLLSSNVAVLLDVRIRANSRKPGFSKRALEALCNSAGIEYRHERRLGTPEWLMRKLRESGRYDWVAYAEHLTGEEEALLQAVELVDGGNVCLLCYEANAAECHRKVVAEELAKRTRAHVVHI